MGKREGKIEDRESDGVPRVRGEEGVQRRRRRRRKGAANGTMIKIITEKKEKIHGDGRER